MPNVQIKLYINYTFIYKHIKPPTSYKKWLIIFLFLNEEEWQHIFESERVEIAKEPYLQSFQYKILNMILNNKQNLYKWKLLQTEKKPWIASCSENS